MWLLFAAAADKTKTIRFGPSLSGVVLREPTLITQAVATLDELRAASTSRASSTSTPACSPSLARCRNGCRSCSAHARPEVVPGRGRDLRRRPPRLSYTRGAYDYLVDNVRQGAEKAGRDWQSLDIGAWIVFAIGRDSAAAKEAARSMMGLYASSMPAEQLERNGVNPQDLQPIIDALGKGDLAGAIELTPPEIAERLSVAGTPDECVAKLRTEIVDAGVNHLIFAITDAALVKALMGRDLDNVASVGDQLQLIHDEVMPAFA